MNPSEQSYETLIDYLAEQCGIISEYWDIFGNRHCTAHKTKAAMLRAMNRRVDTPEQVLQEIETKKNMLWTRVVEPTMTVPVTKQPFSFPVCFPSARSVSIAWSITGEDGERDEYTFTVPPSGPGGERKIGNIPYRKIVLADARTRQTGYYKIEVACQCRGTFPTGDKTITGTSRLIIHPEQAYLPDFLDRRKTWGLVFNLYGIRSSRNWGIGDFGDLGGISRLLAEKGAGFVGINPLHAIPNLRPFGISPYAPMSRLYKNYAYLDVSKIQEILVSHQAEHILSRKSVRLAIQNLQNAFLIDYEEIAFLKRLVLEEAFDYFYEHHYGKSSPRAQAFRDYLVMEGEPLEAFCTYMALLEHFSPCHGWEEWPEPYRDPGSAETLEFIGTHRKEIAFHQYVQWLIDEQIHSVSSDVVHYGMPVGIYHDLAVGSIGSGSDVWSYRNMHALGISLGAPPDDFNVNGQNWGFPPLLPESLEESGFEFYIRIIRKNMKHFGALRIDHALGLFRMFWIPHGMDAKDGAYVRFPEEKLLAIIALESVRNKTMVIAEDLGTISDEARKSLKKCRMLSYRLLYFERNYPNPSFVSPASYPETAIASVTTHDLPTLNGFWKSKDLDDKGRLGMYKDPQMLLRHRDERVRDRKLLLEALAAEGLLPDEYRAHGADKAEMTDSLRAALYAYLSRTPCKLVAVSLDDVAGTLDQQNMPGMLDEYPSWKQKTPCPVDSEKFRTIIERFSLMFRQNGR